METVALMVIVAIGTTFGSVDPEHADSNPRLPKHSKTLRDVIICPTFYLVLTIIQLAPVKLAAVAPSGLRNRYVLARLPVFRSAKK